jgi:transaldolase
MPSSLRIHLYADGANVAEMVSARQADLVQGFTTNPTLMRKAGVSDYAAFAREVLAAIPDRPVSFEVFSDEFDRMERQARIISAWGENVFVKVPITNTRRQSSLPLVRRLSESGIKVNVTAVLSPEQVRGVAEALDPRVSAIVSVFAGRIADTGRDPVPLMRTAKEALRGLPRAKLLWASPRELLNVFQAEAAGCDVITVPPEILKKLRMVGMPLDELSLETVKMFHDDALASGYEL